MRLREQHGQSAYAVQVDRLLASSNYGQRMAQEWLDVARYADTHGFNNDSAREMWRWRDWVIDAFNANMPYDQFITEQLAGDLLPNPTLEQRIATGFCRNHVINSEGGIIEEEYRVEYVADRVRTMSTAWLGLTMECSRCHDHKFDPITQVDYYSLFAFFNNVPEHGEDGRIANAVPMIPAPTRQQQRELAAMRAEIDKLDKQLAEIESDLIQRETVGATSVAAAANLPLKQALRARAVDPVRLTLSRLRKFTSFPCNRPNWSMDQAAMRGASALTRWSRLQLARSTSASEARSRCGSGLTWIARTKWPCFPASIIREILPLKDLRKVTRFAWSMVK